MSKPTAHWVRDKNNYNNPDPNVTVVVTHRVAGDVLPAVVENIEKVLGFEVEVIDHNYMGGKLAPRIPLDFGGSSLSTWKATELETDGWTLCFFAHNIDQVYTEINHALENQGDLSFCRVFTKMWVFACSRELLEKFLVLMKENEKGIRTQAEKELAEWEESSRKLEDSPHLLVSMTEYKAKA